MEKKFLNVKLDSMTSHPKLIQMQQLYLKMLLCFKGVYK